MAYEHTADLLQKELDVVEQKLDSEIQLSVSLNEEVKKLENNENSSPRDIVSAVASLIELLDMVRQTMSEKDKLWMQKYKILPMEKEHQVEGMQSVQRVADYNYAEGERQRKRINIIIAEHCVLKGYYKTAELLAKSLNIKYFVHNVIVETARAIEAELAQHRVEKLINWCNSNEIPLQELGMKLHFQARQLEYIGLIKNRQIIEAVQYARKYFAAFEDTHVNEIGKCMALLVHPEDKAKSPYKELYDDKGWAKLSVNFKNAYFKTMKLYPVSLLKVAVQVGLSSLKTSQCYSEHQKHPKCVVCQPDFNTISKNLPYAQCIKSSLICRITGLPINDDNLPMILPNGQIYSQKGFTKIEDANGAIICPITKTKYKKSEIQKVFIM